MPQEISLLSGEPLTLHLRQAGDTRMLTLRVLPQQLATTVSVGPKRARWPGDNVKLEVKVAGATAGSPATPLAPRLRVLLGIDEFPVTWTRRGDTYTAEIPPQQGAGPWIVRVEVEDQYGHMLGRDFVEISGPAAGPPAPVKRPVPPPAQASR